MAVINEQKANDIAAALAKETFGTKLNELENKFKDIFLLKVRKIMGEGLYNTYLKAPQFFRVASSITLYSSTFGSEISPKELGGFSIRLGFQNHIGGGIPCWNNFEAEIYERIQTDREATEVLKSLLRLTSEYKLFKNKVQCLIYTTIRTEKRLQKEFPEAYQILLKIQNKGAELALLKNAPCDSIENLRATIQSNKANEKESV